MTEQILKLHREFKLTDEWLGSILGLIGAFLLASHSANADWGFVFFLASNVCFINFAVKGGHRGLLVMQIGFTASSLLGVINGFF